MVVNWTGWMFRLTRPYTQVSMIRHYQQCELGFLLYNQYKLNNYEDGNVAHCSVQEDS